MTEYTEIESGTDDDRPQLRAALNACELFGLPLLIAKLDRLSRSAAFLMTLQEAGVRFTCVDMPQACDMTIGIMALVAREERDKISKRTKAALQAAKERGTALGGARENSHMIGGDQRHKGLRVRQDKARHRAELTAPYIQQAMDEGAKNYSEIVRYLEEKQVKTPKGGNKWYVQQVKRIMQASGMELL